MTHFVTIFSMVIYKVTYLIKETNIKGNVFTSNAFLIKTAQHTVIPK